MLHISERQHRFMGTGEGTHEMPEKLLDKLTKRATYYKDQMPKEVPVSEPPYNLTLYAHFNG